MQIAIHHSAEVRMAATAPHFPPLESVTKPNLTTAEVAHYLNLAPQTMRVHACRETGPIRPLRICGRLNWSTAETKRIVGVA
jgi:hypothetical protein